jgi:hypothetical protein
MLPDLRFEVLSAFARSRAPFRSDADRTPATKATPILRTGKRADDYLPKR